MEEPVKVVEEDKSGSAIVYNPKFVWGSRAGIGVDDFVVARYEGHLFRMTVKIAPEFDDECRLYGCRNPGSDVILLIPENDLILWPRVPSRFRFVKGHYVLFLSGANSSCLRLGKLEIDVELNMGGNLLKVKRSLVDGKTNFVHILDLGTKKVFKLRPNAVIFDLLSAEKDVQDEDYLRDGLLYLGVKLDVVSTSDK